MSPKRQFIVEDKKESIEVTEAAQAPFEEEVHEFAEPIEEKADYEPRSWKDVLIVYHCNHCGTDMTSEDNMKLHIVKHYPEAEQNSVLDKLTKGK